MNDRLLMLLSAAMNAAVMISLR